MDSLKVLLSRLPGATPHLTLLVLLSTGLNLYGITWGLPNVGDWTNMSLAPLKPLTFAKHLLYQEQWLFHYPPFHFLLLAIVYSPYVLYLLATGGLRSPTDVYPFGLADPELSLTIFTLLARLTSAFMGTGLVIVNYLIVRRLYGSRAAFVSSLLIASSYPIVHFSHNANVDIPYLFWLSLVLYSFVRLIETFRTKWYVLLAVFTALAVGTKHTSYALVAGLIPVLLYYHYRYRRETRPDGNRLAALFDRRFVYAAAIFAVLLLVIFNPISNWDGFTAHIAHHMKRSVGGSWVVQTSSSALQGHLDLASQYADYIRQANGLPAFILIASGFVYCLVRYPKTSLIVVVPMSTYYLLYLRNFGTHHLRYILPVLILLTWQAGKLSADAYDMTKMPRWVPRFALGLILAHSIVYGFTVDFLYARDPRYAAERWIDEHVPAGSRVLAIEPRFSLPRLPKPIHVTYRDLWDFNGNLVADITDLDVDYVVVGMSIPRRSHSEKWKVAHVKNIDVHTFLKERGYEAVTSFKTNLPAWGADVPDIHVINPRVSVWKKSVTPPLRASQATLHDSPQASRGR